MASAQLENNTNQRKEGRTVKWFFTADTHFGHANIMKHCNRPFKSVNEMDETLIDNWNMTVQPGSQIVFIGDLTLDHKYDRVRHNYIRHLTGNIIWVKGNHDYWMKKSALEFKHIYHKQFKDGPFVACCHYPLRSWNKSQHGGLQLHGHSHGEIEPWFNQFDVGVDNAYRLLGAYRPFELQEIFQIIKENNKMAKGHDYHTDYDNTA